MNSNSIWNQKQFLGLTTKHKACLHFIWVHKYFICDSIKNLETIGFEPMTLCVQSIRSTNWTTSPMYVKSMKQVFFHFLKTIQKTTGDRTRTCMTLKPQGLNLVCLPISPHPHESWDWLVVHFISLSWMEHWGSHFPFCLQKKQNWF